MLTKIVIKLRKIKSCYPVYNNDHFFNVCSNFYKHMFTQTSTIIFLFISCLLNFSLTLSTSLLPGAEEDTCNV